MKEQKVFIRGDAGYVDLCRWCGKEPVRHRSSGAQWPALFCRRCFGDKSKPRDPDAEMVEVAGRL